MKRLLVKVFIVTAICVASLLTVAAEADAGLILRITNLRGNVYFFVQGSCASLHPGANACVDLLPTAVYEVVNNNPAEVYLVVDKQRYLMPSDVAQAKFDQIFAESGNNIDKARDRMEKELPPLVEAHGTTSPARIASIFDRWPNRTTADKSPQAAPGVVWPSYSSTGNVGSNLKVQKIVVNTLGAATPAQFAMTLNCTPAPGNLAFNVPANGTHVFTNVPMNANCTVIEAPLAQVIKVKGCGGGTASWATTYSPAGPIVANAHATIVVTNTLSCDGKPEKGSLKVIKTVVNGTGGPGAIPATFAMTADCQSSGPFMHAMTVVPGGPGTTITGIAAASQCTVKETPLASIAHFDGCKGGTASWTTLIAPAQPVTIPPNGTTTVTVRNTLTCDKPPKH